MTSTDFASAKERLRRRKREAERHYASVSDYSNHSSATLQRLPSGLQSPTRGILRAWNSIKGREGTRPAFRVGQVDAELLDEELLSLLQGQAGEALKHYGVRYTATATTLGIDNR